MLQGPNPFLLSPSSPSSTINLLPMPNLNKKRKEKEVAKEEEMVYQKEPKQQKIAKDEGRAFSVKSKEDYNMTEMCH